MRTLKQADRRFGPAELLEVFDEYDGPRLFSCRDDEGQQYLALWVDETAEADLWLYVAVSESRLQAAKEGSITLRDIFLSAESGEVLELVTYRDGRPTTVDRTLATAEIPRGWLPQAELTLLRGP
jgi:hypothetical protein